MLYLFNDVVFDLGDLTGLLQDGKIPLSFDQIERLPPGELTGLIQEAVFRDPGMARNNPDQTQHLCALVAYRAPGANAVLALPNDPASGPHDVGVRFANAPITTMAYLWKQQLAGELTTDEINAEVWSRVTGSLQS
jgi:hypothetical protein